MNKKILLTTLMLTAAALLHGQVVEISDEFNMFKRERAAVALEDHSDKELWKIEGPVNDIECGHGVLKIKGKPRTEIRIFSKQHFMYGTFSARLRYDTAGRGFNLYAGFANDEPWADGVAWIQNTGSRNGILLTGFKRKLNPVNQRFGTGPLKAGEWFDVKIVWKPESVELFINGVSKGKATFVPGIPQAPLPIVFCIYSKENDFCMSVDKVHVIGNKPAEDDFKKAIKPPTKVSMPQMPAPAVNPAPQIVPSSIVQDKNILTLENAFYRMSFDTAKGLKINEFFNKYIQKNLLAYPGDFFAVYEKNVRIQPGLFKVSSVKVTAGDKSKTAVILLKNLQNAIVSTLKLTVEDESPELGVEMTVAHGDNKKRTLQVVIPLMTGIQIAKDPKQDEFFYPFESGAAGDLDCEIHHPYGVTLFFPVMSAWNPAAGGGCYFFTKSDDGFPVDMLVKKQSGKEFDGAEYKMIGVSPKGIFPEKPGIHMAYRHCDFELGKGEKGVVTPSVIGVHTGNFHEPMKRYADRARKVWFKKPYPTPQWYQDSYGFLSAHTHSGLHLLHTPQSFGFWDDKTKSYRYADQVTNRERNVVMEFCGWTYGNPEVAKKYNTLEKIQAAKLPVINAGNVGDNRYNTDLGGLPLLRAEIKRIQDKGGRITLYTFPTGVAKGTKFEKLFGDKWAAMRAPGKYATNYTADGMGYNWCQYEVEFGEQLGAEFARILKETGADGYRLDVMSRLGSCFNPKHSHYKGTLRSTVDTAGAGKTLLAFVRQAREVNPDAIVTTEHGASDYLCQFHDGYFSENIIWYGGTGMWEPYQALNMYGLVFQRFYFPEIKTWIHGPSTKELGVKMSLFNAVGYACSNPAGVVSIKTLEENSDAFNSMIQPTPLVPVLEKEVFANFFPGKNKRVWCVWNRSKNTLTKPSVPVDIKAGHRYVEVYKDDVVKVTDNAIAPVLDADTIGVVVEFPEAMEVKVEDNFVKINVKGENPDSKRFVILYDEDKHADDPLYLSTHNGEAQIQLRNSYKKLIVKLFDGNYLIDEVVIRK